MKLLLLAICLVAVYGHRYNGPTYIELSGIQGILKPRYVGSHSSYTYGADIGPSYYGDDDGYSISRYHTSLGRYRSGTSYGVDLGYDGPSYGRLDLGYAGSGPYVTERRRVTVRGAGPITDDLDIGPAGPGGRVGPLGPAGRTDYSTASYLEEPGSVIQPTDPTSDDTSAPAVDARSVRLGPYTGMTSRYDVTYGVPGYGYLSTYRRPSRIGYSRTYTTTRPGYGVYPNVAGRAGGSFYVGTSGLGETRDGYMSTYGTTRYTSPGYSYARYTRGPTARYLYGPTYSAGYGGSTPELIGRAGGGAYTMVPATYGTTTSMIRPYGTYGTTTSMVRPYGTYGTTTSMVRPYGTYGTTTSMVRPYATYGRSILGGARGAAGTIAGAVRGAASRYLL